MISAWIIHILITHVLVENKCHKWPCGERDCPVVNHTVSGMAAKACLSVTASVDGLDGRIGHGMPTSIAGHVRVF
jgi:hypothetical protein